MKEKVIDKTVLCEISKIFASNIGTCGGRPNMDCSTCLFADDCLSMEIAKQVHAMGYVKTDSVVNNTQTVEAIAKDIACVRGYGCNSQDSCAKCVCASVLGCIPLQLANGLVSAGYQKNEE